MTFTATELNRAVEVATLALKTELREANKEIGQLTEQVNMLRYAFKGLCGETLSLRIEISGHELVASQDAYRYLDFLAAHAAKRISHEALARFEDVYKLREENARLKYEAALHRPFVQG